MNLFGSSRWGGKLRGQPEIGVTDPICPHCRKPMGRMPRTKSKCKQCGNHVYVRTRPQD